MNGHLIEVFVEDNCKACEEVLEVIRSLQDHHQNTLRVFRRDEHRSVFTSRSVLVCPATFVNHRLAFYGTFSGDEFSQYLKFPYRPPDED